ncbi:MAG: septum formation protein Maf [Alphaproteobacteria bacterium]|nr:MAG: septum formation protein Maf [Alphaproteobacteria bacterium]
MELNYNGNPIYSMLILASASPRRLQLLQQIGVKPDLVVPAQIDESPENGERPATYARRMAKEKAQEVQKLHPKAFILSADTVVVCGNQILPKAEDIATAEYCLKKLSGRRHTVLGGVCLLHPDGKISLDIATTKLKFRRLQPQEIKQYLDGKEWHGKAGGYAIQGSAAGFIPWINGCYNNVVGLPLAHIYPWLQHAGLVK